MTTPRFFNSNNKKGHSRGVSLIGIRRRPILPGRFQPSTFGAEGLNFCVRHGNRWNPFAIITGNLSDALAPWQLHRTRLCQAVTNLFFDVLRTSWNEALDLLVSSSCMCYHTSTDDLSPGSLPGVLLPFRNGNLLLKVGFTLRCFQRLSLPHFASLLCRWHDNSCTSGASIPVLSY